MLRWDVDRNAGGRDRTRRTLTLENAGETTASAVKPIRVTIVRGGRTRTMQWNSLNGDYSYRARKGERVGAMAVYAEDSSGYDRATVKTFEFLPVKLPVDLAGTVGALGALPPIQMVFGLLPPVLQVAVPLDTQGGAFGSQTCARLEPLAVQEATAASRARTYRR